MTEIFIAMTDPTRDPVSLVARDIDEAFRLFHLWRGVHAPELADADVMVAELSERDLACRLELAAVLDLGRIGVAWWASDRGKWVVGTADDDALGVIAPPRPPVRCFVFDDVGDKSTVYVFAETIDAAVENLHTFNRTWERGDLTYAGGSEMSPWLLIGSMVTLREHIFEGKTGVGFQDGDGSWQIIPADHVPPLKRLKRKQS